MAWAAAGTLGLQRPLALESRQPCLKPSGIVNNNGVINTSSPACLRHRRKHGGIVSIEPKGQQRSSCVADHRSCEHKAKSNEELNKFRTIFPRNIRQSNSFYQSRSASKPLTPELDQRNLNKQQKQKCGFHSNSDCLSTDERPVKRGRSPSAPQIFRPEMNNNPWVERGDRKFEEHSKTETKDHNETAHPSINDKSSPKIVFYLPIESSKTLVTTKTAEDATPFIFKETSV